MSEPTPASPVAYHFQREAQRCGYALDEAQRIAIAHLDDLLRRLRRGPTLFRRASRGLYLWGPVGRGKSWLMDGFFRSADLARKRRIHFHAFFRQLHDGMFRRQGQADALGGALDELLGDCRLLCFDEFHVHDIGDAMLITRLFRELFRRGITLVCTSNYAPRELLPNPLYHERFLPAIRLIEARMDVLEVAGAQDYRTCSPVAEAVSGYPSGAYCQAAAAAVMEGLGLAVPAPAERVMLRSGARSLLARAVRGDLVWFAFADLCEAPTAVMDYLALGERFSTWVLDGVPPMARCSVAAQQRFINLVDVLHDNDRRLFLRAEAPLAELVEGSELPADMQRTASRLAQLRQLRR
ncbi:MULTISPECIES: cell division protein ZapE [Pseudomonas aeruginosa group]|uniref:Cell division protein ZapE n=3 Tax=Pseudomonas aeruginosa group TaxID=136841 RepID=A0ABD7K0T0_PSEAI|nr:MULTISPECIES: cell division protein ZapE [Pseudomonas aeruginosa group]ABR81183.2 ATPase, AFG1 family [Pseudomonas aeruginosa PA7]AVR69711.1 cell division protein ZapE [Pseudomonas paraeruginosa]KAB0752250.1 cell division protein ZapE [Pseudomonas aeruginosa]KSC86693.1 cell division protein ZapE [Pseudomonas aeruginosa]KSD21816.1 cell division protein ZapE [Pseudomonas aeruginosa]